MTYHAALTGTARLCYGARPGPQWQLREVAVPKHHIRDADLPQRPLCAQTHQKGQQQALPN